LSFFLCIDRSLHHQVPNTAAVTIDPRRRSPVVVFKGRTSFQDVPPLTSIQDYDAINVDPGHHRRRRSTTLQSSSIHNAVAVIRRHRRTRNP
jgi:hypothetical protein